MTWKDRREGVGRAWRTRGASMARTLSWENSGPRRNESGHDDALQRAPHRKLARAAGVCEEVKGVAERLVVPRVSHARVQRRRESKKIHGTSVAAAELLRRERVSEKSAAGQEVWKAVRSGVAPGARTFCLHTTPHLQHVSEVVIRVRLIKVFVEHHAQLICGCKGEERRPRGATSERARTPAIAGSPHAQRLRTDHARAVLIKDGEGSLVLINLIHGNSRRLELCYLLGHRHGARLRLVSAEEV